MASKKTEEYGSPESSGPAKEAKVTKVDVAACANLWSPEQTRIDRCVKEIKTNRIGDLTRVRGLVDGPLRGGDNIVLNTDSFATTLSFCFKKGNAWYGMTAGCLASRTGEPILTFVRQGDPTVRQIGTVVSLSRETDSLVFTIDTTVQDVQTPKDMLLAENSGLGDEPFTLPTKGTSNPAAGSVLVGYGGKLRGAIGKVTTSAVSAEDAQKRRMKYLPGDIGISSTDDQKRRLTYPGDCGTIFVDETGTGLFMQHLLVEKGNSYESFGVPLEKIVAAHPLLQEGGDDMPAIQTQHIRYFTSRQIGYVSNIIFPGLEQRHTPDLGYFPKMKFEFHASVRSSSFTHRSSGEDCVD